MTGAQNILNDVLRAQPGPNWREPSPEYVRRVALTMHICKMGDWVSTPTAAQAAEIEASLISKSGKIYTKWAENFLRIMGADFTFGRHKAIDGVRLSLGGRDRLKQLLDAEFVEFVQKKHGEGFTNALLGEIATL